MVSEDILELILTGSITLRTWGYSASKGNILQLLTLNNGNMIMKTWPLSTGFFIKVVVTSSVLYLHLFFDKISTSIHVKCSCEISFSFS